MSQEDAAAVRRAYEVWNESGPAAVIEQFWAEDAVYREGPGWPDAGVYGGRAAALERMQSVVELVGPLEVRIDDLIDPGDGRLIACVRMLGESATSDTPYTHTFAVVHRLRDGLVVEADYYLDRADALEAVGLRERPQVAATVFRDPALIPPRNRVFLALTQPGGRWLRTTWDAPSLREVCAVASGVWASDDGRTMG